MMSLTSRFQNRTKQIVDKAGKSIFYKHSITTDYDPDTGTTVDFILAYPKAFKVEANASEIKSPNLVGKDLAVFLVAGIDLPIVPRVGDEIVYVNIKDLPPGTNIEWESSSFWYGLPPSTSSTVRVQMIKEHWAGDEVSLYRLVCAAS